MQRKKSPPTMMPISAPKETAARICNQEMQEGKYVTLFDHEHIIPICICYIVMHHLFFIPQTNSFKFQWLTTLRPWTLIKFQVGGWSLSNWLRIQNYIINHKNYYSKISDRCVSILNKNHLHLPFPFERNVILGTINHKSHLQHKYVVTIVVDTS